MEKTSFAPVPKLSSAELRDVLFGLLICIFLAALDQTIVAVALPDIGRQMPGAELLAWVISGYVLALTVSTPIFGKLGDIYGRRRLLAVSIILFVVASLLCGLAQDMSQLVAARLLQGAGAGGLLAIVQALIGDLIAPAERGRYQAWFSGVFALAGLIGPPLGSVMTSQWSWRWVFLINLPLGIVAYLLCMARLEGLREFRRDARIDYFGTLLFVVGISGLLILLDELGRPGQGQKVAWLAGMMAVLGLALFAWQQRRAREALLPLALMRIGPVRSGWLIILFANFQALGLVIMLPLYAQGTGANAAGLLMAVAFGAPLGAYVGGYWSSRARRYKPMIIAGSLLLPISLTLLALLPSPHGPATLSVLVLCGLALGLQFPTALVAVQSAAPRDHLGVATGACGLFRGLGGALGVAMLSAILWNLLARCGECGTLIPGQALDALGVGPLQDVFQQLFLVDAVIAMLPLLVALRLEDHDLEREGRGQAGAR